MTQYGAVIRFKAGTTEAQAARALARIAAVIETETVSWNAEQRRFVESSDPRALVRAYNPEHGTPVWYIP